MPTPPPAFAFDSTELRRIADTLDNLAAADVDDLGAPRLELDDRGIRIVFEQDPTKTTAGILIPINRQKETQS